MTDAAVVEGLSKSKLATELTPAQCQSLAATMTVRDLRQGEVLVREGDTDDHLYVVVSGALGVVKAAGTDNELTLNAMRPGDVVGELSFLDGATRYASLVAMSDTRVLGLSRGDLEGLLERDPAPRLSRDARDRAHRARHPAPAVDADRRTDQLPVQDPRSLLTPHQFGSPAPGRRDPPTHRTGAADTGSCAFFALARFSLGCRLGPMDRRQADRQPYDEMYTADGQVRPPYAVYSDWLIREPEDALRQKRAEADSLFHRVGITFAVYGEQDGNERLIPFDIVPRILSADEWRKLAAGLRQRVQGAERLHRRHLPRPGHPARRAASRPSRSSATRSTGRRCRAWTCPAASTPTSPASTSCAPARASSTCSRTTCACRRACRTCSKTAR